MRYWKLKDGTLVEGTKLEYYCYKLQCLKDRENELNKKYYRNKVLEYLERIRKEMEI